MNQQTGRKIIEIWVIYDHPRDWDKPFVARKFNGETPTGDTLWGDTIDDVRAQLPPGLTRFDRNPLDDAIIVETWL